MQGAWFKGQPRKRGFCGKWLLLPQTERLLPFALRLFYIWCEKRTTNPAPHSLRRARQWQWVISPSALVALTAVETPAPGPCCCSS